MLERRPKLSSCLLVMIFLFSSAKSRPHDVDDGGSSVGQRDLLLAAVKAGILNSLGMDKEPRPTQKASEGELQRMYQLYRATLRGMRANSSQPSREPSATSTVLFPTSVDELQREDHTESGVQWYRAVFLRNPNIQAALTLTRAELKISRQILNKRSSFRREDFKVEVKQVKSADTALSVVSANISSSQDVTLDIRPTVSGWLRRDDGQPLVVDVRMPVDEDNTGARPSISLELSHRVPTVSKRRRLPRSNKEDDCNEQGWCCRKSITLSFKDIGWTDWVVAPTEYTMHLCDGSCPHNYKPASMHTQVKSRLHQIMKGGTPHPCCVPAAYEPMVLMHYDSRGKLKLTRFNDFIVSKCHCA
ncbi:bone morphogenetic protein 4 [Synchiropus picturatus]